MSSRTVKHIPRLAASARQKARAMRAGLQKVDGKGGGGGKPFCFPCLNGFTSQDGLDITRCDVRHLRRFARALEKHWFLEWIVGTRASFYAPGFRLQDEEAWEWARESARDPSGMPYPWLELAADVWAEFLLMDSAVLLWRRDPNGDQPADVLPRVTVLNSEQVVYQDALGADCICLDCSVLTGGADLRKTSTPERDARLIAEYGATLGKAMISGAKEVILQEGEDGWHFTVARKCKRGNGLGAPSVVGIFNDLDFLEAVQAGDWAGAHARRNVREWTRQGHAVTSGNLAGQPLYEADEGDLNKILDFFQNHLGKTHTGENYDTEHGWHLFPSDFFSDNKTREAMFRLTNWGGAAALMLMEGRARDGVSPYLSMMLRAEARRLRGIVNTALEGVLNHPDFLPAKQRDRRITTRSNLRWGRLEVSWSDSGLYTCQEIVDKSTRLRAGGFMSTQTGRALNELDHDVESARMKEEHDEENRLGITPGFESAQGILPGLEDDGSNSTGGGGNSGQSGSGGPAGNGGGRPARA